MKLHPASALAHALIACSFLVAAAGCGSSGEGGGTGANGSGGATTSNSGGAPGPATNSGGRTGTGASSGGMVGGTASGGQSTGNGGSAVTNSGGRTSSGGAAGGTRTGGSTGSGGAPGSGGANLPGVMVSASCRTPTWPTAVGAQVNISGTMSVSGTYDGRMAVHEGNLDDCGAGAQGSTTPIMEVADGGTVRNVIFGRRVGDGIHCTGSCTLENVWFPNICDDAITMLGGSGKTMTISNSGFKNARDKTIQHNGDGSTVVLNNVFVDTAGKLYRSCGQGCSSSARRTLMASNLIALGVDQVVGVSTNDHATLTNVCVYRSGEICKTYLPGSETESTVGANMTPEGPDANCTYTAANSHALVDRVAGNVSTDVFCTGPNSAKDGMTNNTACVTGFETCLKGCAPGLFGFKQINCVAGRYAGSGSGCVMPADATIAAHLSSANVPMSTTRVTNNSACTTEWAWGNDGAGKYCVCVPKPGYYQTSSSWWVWDCQTQWW